MKTVPTYTAEINIGLREGYAGPLIRTSVLKDSVQAYVDEVGLCATFTDTQFIYPGGREPGLKIGLINYPRFPKPNTYVKAQAITIASRLMVLAKQQRVTVVCTDETIMLEQSHTQTQ